jgi:hypothetical protein
MKRRTLLMFREHAKVLSYLITFVGPENPWRMSALLSQRTIPSPLHRLNPAKGLLIGADK